MARYNSYLIRVWHSKRHEQEQLAIRLEHVQDGTSTQYAEVDELLDAIRALLNRSPQYEAGEQPPKESTNEEKT